MPINSSSPKSSQLPASAVPFVLPAAPPARRITAASKSGNVAEETLAEMLSSALVASDCELGQILKEVDIISRALKSDVPDVQLLRVAAHHAVWCAIRQALVDREIRQLALTDDLTSLYNRRGFFAAATQQLKLAERNSRDMLLFYCDVDGMKVINDSHGHREGDLALVRVADALERTFRKSDVLARIGGDEFVVLASEARELSENAMLRRLEKHLQKSGDGEASYRLSLSVGVSRFSPKQGMTLADLMGSADKAMYARKQGRHAEGKIS